MRPQLAIYSNLYNIWYTLWWTNITTIINVRARAITKRQSRTFVTGWPFESPVQLSLPLASNSGQVKVDSPYPSGVGGRGNESTPALSQNGHQGQGAYSHPQLPSHSIGCYTHSKLLLPTTIINVRARAITKRQSRTFVTGWPFESPVQLSLPLASNSGQVKVDS